MVTKPSFMNTLPAVERVSIFLITASFISVVYLVLIGIVLLLSLTLPKIIQHWLKFFSLLFPTLILSILALLLIDNFTYTVLGFGIVHSERITRAMYVLLLIVISYLVFNEIGRLSQKVDQLLSKRNNRNVTFIFSILGVILLAVGIFPLLINSPAASAVNLKDSGSDKPHIFLITAEGINAENMSLYGYDRKTTPFLDTLSASSLVAQNAFTNSGNTSGSIISILTSKSPIETRVLYPPDILQGDDAFQHLPGILRSNGYYTAQFSLDHYVDAYQLNIRNGFDEANGRSAQGFFFQRLNNWLPANISYFIYDMGYRMIDRLQHIFFIRQMSDPYSDVNSPEEYEDMSKINSVLNLLDSRDQPVFAHIHWMGTHGLQFYPETQVFSAGRNTDSQGVWDTDFYDDSILEFDQAMGKFYAELENRGIADQSILIITSDHGQQWTTEYRLPLIIRFPYGEHQSNLIANTQNMDVVPTILDYLGLDIPQWINGVSMINGVPQERAIYSFSTSSNLAEDGSIQIEALEPPFFQFAFANMVLCDTWYSVDLENHSIREKLIQGHVGDCDRVSSTNDAVELIIDYFNQYDYDTSSLKKMQQ